MPKIHIIPWMSNACLHRLLSPAPLALQQSVGPLTCQCGPRFNLGSRSVEPWLSAAGSWVWAESTQPFWAQPLLLGDTLAILNLTDSLWPHRLWTLSVIFVSLQVFLQTQFLDRTCSDLSSPLVPLAWLYHCYSLCPSPRWACCLRFDFCWPSFLS